MEDSIKRRVLSNADWFLTNEEATVRKVASLYGLSKSTVHRDLTYLLPKIDRDRYDKVRDKLAHNSEIAVKRGGESTRRKFLELRSINEQDRKAN